MHYRLQDPPAGFDSWVSYYRSIGVPEEELDEGFDSVVDAEGIGPRIWFQRVPDAACRQTVTMSSSAHDRIRGAVRQDQQGRPRPS